MGFPGGSVVKNLPANAGDVGDMSLIPGLGKSPGEGNGNPLNILAGKSHGQRSRRLQSKGLQESDTTSQLSNRNKKPCVQLCILLQNALLKQVNTRLGSGHC